MKKFLVTIVALAFVALATASTPAFACYGMECQGGGGSYEAGFGQRGYGMPPPYNRLAPYGRHRYGDPVYYRQHQSRGYERRTRIQAYSYHTRTTTRTYLGTEKVFRGVLLVPRGGGQNIFIPAGSE